MWVSGTMSRVAGSYWTNSVKNTSWITWMARSRYDACIQITRGAATVAFACATYRT